MFPALTPEDLQEALAYAAWCIDEAPAPLAVPEIEPLPSPALEPQLPTDPEVPAAEAQEETGPAEPFLEESLELFHPDYPDHPTVVVNRHGLLDRRWGTHPIAWSDIREIQRKSSRKTVDIILHNPEFYLSSMPFFKRLRAQIKLAFHIQTFHLDTSSLGIRTKDLYFAVNRLWLRHRGKRRFRKRRRVRVTGKTEQARRAREWERYQPM